ncbi:MAG: polysaccharide biosynthesis protein [Lachnospiraceae bacterium]|nr:polysaccharide biosynthesis protein [Lachnospiraceae bacterium]
MSDRNRSDRNTNIKGAAAAGKSSGGIIVQAGMLAAATIIVRIIGILYRAPLTAVIGDLGNGFYGTAFNIYTIILIVSSYGIPSAISKLMSQKIAVGEFRSAQKVFHAALLYAVIAGTVASLFLYFGAPLLVPPGSVMVLRVFAPTIFLFGILGALRGYFQANQTMAPTSISQILEQIVNAAVSIGAAWLLIRQVSGQDETTRAQFGAAGSALGTGAGVLAALLFMLFIYLRSAGFYRERIRTDTRSREESFGAVMRATILVITPFILSSFIMNLSTSLDQTIYLKHMINVRGAEETAVTTINGLFSNKAVVICNIPISIATAVSAAIIPHISTSYARGMRRETKRRTVSACRMTLLIAIPCAVGLGVLARPVTMILFPQWETLDLAAELLRAMALTVVLYSVSTITTAALQATGKMAAPLIGAGIALAVQTAALYAMLYLTKLDAYTLVWSSLLYALVIFIANEWFLTRHLKYRVNILKLYVKPTAASIVMGAAALGIYTVLMRLLDGPLAVYYANLIACAAAILAAVVIYFFVLLKIGAICAADIERFPGGRKLSGALRSAGWL